MNPEDMFDQEPIVLERRESEYTHGELIALLAPVLGFDPEQIREVAIVADLGGAFTFGGSNGTDSAKMLLVGSIISGVLNA